MLKQAKMLGRAFLGDDRAQMTGAEEGVEVVVGLVVGGLMAAFLLPLAINEIVGIDTSSWTGGAAELWELLPVMIVLAIFLFFVQLAIARSGRI